MGHVFLRDWAPGDVVTAADMQAMADAVAMLETMAPGGAAVRSGRHRRRVEDDGPVGLPWQVYVANGADGPELRVVPGRVLVSMGTAGAEYAEMGLGVRAVEDFSVPSGGESVVVYLEMTGRVSVERLAADGEAVTVDYLQVTAVDEVALRVTCRPVEAALRVWPLAVYTAGFEQPVTQLLWGELSALECRGIVDAAGAVVWPADRSEAAEWGTEEHRAGMATLCAVDFSTEMEEVRGELSGCVASDGALELYLGPWTGDEGGEDGDGEGDFGEDDDEEDDEEDDAAPEGPFVPVGGGSGGSGGGDDGGDDGDDDDGGGGIIKVRYGYEAGAGFSSCELVQAGDGKYYWELVLDTGWLVQQLAGLPADCAVVYTAGGTQEGTQATVEMGLGACSAAAVGMGVSGLAELVFHGTNAVDASRKRAVCRTKYQGSPVWSEERRWYLSATEVHSGAKYVRVEAARHGWQPGGFVEAAKWYRVRVDGARWRRDAMTFFKSELSKVRVSDRASSVSADSSVSGVLSGTALSMTLAMQLG